MKAIFFSVCLVALPLSAWAEQVTSDILDQPPVADVIILGEVHDNPRHHLNQARAVQAVAPAAVVWEMLTPSQAALMPEQSADADLIARAVGWQGWPDFALYYPIVAAAAGAEHFGGGLPRGEVRRAFDIGAAEVFGPEAARFGLSEALEETEQARREQGQYDAHCQAMPLAMMGGMVEAQRLRDAALARAVLQAFAKTGGPVVLITGNGHARSDWGVPAVLRRAAPEVSVWALAQLEHVPEGDAPWDAWLLTEAFERPDPCATLTGG